MNSVSREEVVPQIIHKYDKHILGYVWIWPQFGQILPKFIKFRSNLINALDWQQMVVWLLVWPMVAHMSVPRLTHVVDHMTSRHWVGSMHAFIAALQKYEINFINMKYASLMHPSHLINSWQGRLTVLGVFHQVKTDSCMCISSGKYWRLRVYFIRQIYWRLRVYFIR